MTGYTLLSDAFVDLEEIRSFIAKDSPDAADRVVDEIFDKIRSLVDFPAQGHLRPDLSSRRVRFVTVYEYLIAYTPDERPLVVMAVVHGRRDPRVISKMLRRRS